MFFRIHAFAVLWFIMLLGTSYGHGGQRKFSDLDYSPVIFVPDFYQSDILVEFQESASITPKQRRRFNLLNTQERDPDFWKHLTLKYNNDTRLTSNLEGVDTRVPLFGDHDFKDILGKSHKYKKFAKSFENIINNLEKFGYTRGVNMQVAPYDCRKGPNEQQDYFESLKSLIESFSNTSKGLKVVMVAHGMGAPLIVDFLRNQSQEWKDKYVKALVSAGGAYGGRIEAFQYYTTGIDLTWFNNLAAKDVQNLLSSFPSTAYSLPNGEVYGNEDVFVETPNNKYTSKNLEEFFVDANLNVAREMFNDVRKYSYNNKTNSSDEAPGVSIHALYGSTFPTITKMKFNINNLDNASDSNPVIVYGNGDRKTDLKSLEFPKYWKADGTNKKQIFLKEFSENAEHADILNNKDVQEYIRTVLRPGCLCQ